MMTQKQWSLHAKTEVCGITLQLKQLCTEQCIQMWKKTTGNAHWKTKSSACRNCNKPKESQQHIQS